jgi:hypothetical protein
MPLSSFLSISFFFFFVLRSSYSILQFLAYVPYLKKIKEGLWEQLAVCASPYLPTAVRRRLGKHLPAATNTHIRTELTDVVFSVRSVSYQILNMQWKESRRLVLPRASCVMLIPSFFRSYLACFSSVLLFRVFEPKI